MKKTTLCALLLQTSLLIAPSPESPTSLISPGSPSSSTSTQPPCKNASFSSQPETLNAVNEFLEKKRRHENNAQCVASIYAVGTIIALFSIILTCINLVPTQRQ